MINVINRCQAGNWRCNMARKTFAQVLKDANVDIEREYERLYQLFYKFKIPDSSGTAMTLY